MYDIALQQVTTDQVLNMGDGLATAGQPDLARQLYRSALSHERNFFMRYRLRLRIGYLTNPRPHILAQLEMLRGLEKQYAPMPAFVGSGLATWQKTIPFMDDERFMALEEKHQHLLPIPNWHWNLQTVIWAVQQSRDVDGDLVELGVFKGHTTLFTADYLNFQDWPKRWLLFDTFEGIPDDQVDPGWEEINRTVYKDLYAYEDVVERFAPFPNIEVIRGRVPEILEGRAPDKISFLHIDLNNTTAELAALDRLVERISPSGVLILDDYTWASARAQFEAERKWFTERGLHVLPLPTGQGVFVKK
jgi:hypothetical protein